MRNPRLIPALVATLAIVQGCTETNPTAEHSSDELIVSPDEHAIKQAEAAAAGAEAFVFSTAETVEASSYGLMGDGLTDNTALFKTLLGDGNRTVYVEPGDYVTGRLLIPANTVLVLKPGVIIRDSGQLAGNERLIEIRTHNVRIEGTGAKIVAKRSDYTSGEQRHGVYIFGADRVVIDGLESSAHGGDGFYIGGPAGLPSTNIVLRGCKADNNRRQGLSITNARKVRVVDCEFTNTDGTPPEFGIDIEPNSPGNYMDDILIVRPYTDRNSGGGVMILLLKLDATSRPVDLTIIDHTSVQDARPLRIEVPEEVKATVIYNRTS